jgi:hypothetical protein
MLMQHNSLSTILLNIVVDMLSIIIERKGGGGLSIHKYTDSTILFMEHDIEKAINLKFILSAFEQLLRLKINFHKSELFWFGEAQDEAAIYADIFGCGQDQYPIGYLGILICYRRLTNDE